MMNTPTALNVKLKFKPAFDNIDDATVEFAIEEALVLCGKIGSGSWVDDENQVLAVMYYSAHIMQVAQARAASGGTGQLVSSERTPDLSISYAGTGKSSEIMTTVYGERFMMLVRLNFPAVLVANSAVPM